MSTTKLFVELIVIGSGAFVWVVLLVLTVFGYNPVSLDLLKSPTVAVATLPIIYVLGIITDRMADAIFEWKWDRNLKATSCGSRENYERAKRSIVHRSDKLAELMEYGRSRLRICRGWALNSVLTIIVLNVFLWSSPDLGLNKVRLSTFCSTGLLLLAIGAWFSWRRIAEGEYRIIAAELTEMQKK
jgi:hypothetical protein